MINYAPLSFRYNIAFMTFILLVLINPVSGKSEEISFNVGEKMTFKIRWSFVVAAEATLEVMQPEDLDGTPALHFVYTAKTSPFVDAFYRVRDRIESWTDTGLNHSLLYLKRHERNSVKETRVQFDWVKMEARQINKDKMTDPVNINKNTFDPLSVFYAFRVGEPDKDNSIKVHLTDGKKIIKANARIIEKQQITIGEKTYDTILVVPEIEGVSGVFQKTKNAKMQIWITDDNKRIPIRIKSRVTVGSFIADLVSYSQGDNTHTIIKKSQ
jgi:hypothetical protein